MSKIAGVKVNKTLTGKIKSVEINYAKFHDYVDDFLDGLEAAELLKESTISLKEAILKQDKKRNIKR